MMRVGVVGINHKLAHLKLRELLANACQRRFGASFANHGEHTFVLLSTCNRTEIYFSSEDLTVTHSYLLNILLQEVGGEVEDFNQKLYSYFGYNCFNHLSRVTAGLDSAIIAETEIQGQVKVAYEMTQEYANLPCDLHFMFQKALHIGKQVRTTLPLGRGMPDLEDAIYNIGAQMFPTPKQAKVLFVGASEINHKIIRLFKQKGIKDITLCNRSKKPGLMICEDQQIKSMEWGNLTLWHTFDWIICGTKAPYYLLNKNHIPGDSPHQQKLIIDLSVPRNAEPALAREPYISLLNIDQVNRTLKARKRNMNHMILQAEEIIAEAAKKYTKAFQDKQQRQLISEGCKAMAVSS